MVHINKSDNEHHLLRFLSTLRPKHTDIICRSSLFIEKNVIYYYVLHIMYRCRKMSVYQLQSGFVKFLLKFLYPQFLNVHFGNHNIFKWE